MGQSLAGDEEAHAATDQSTSNNVTPIDPQPKWKAAIEVEIDKETCRTLNDTGCNKSAINHLFLRQHPNLYKNKIQPHKGRTISIDGSKVETIGIINIPFRIQGRHMRMNCRIVKNLVYDLVLGWDFFTKYNCSIHPKDGYVMIENEKIPLIPNSVEMSSSHFALAEDIVVPAMSKVITKASFYINPNDNITTTNLVEVEPLPGHISKVAVGRNVSKVENGCFPVELINPHESSVTVKTDEVLGHVTFTSDEELAGMYEETDIVLAYGGEDSGYESVGASSEDEGAFSATEEDPPPSKRNPQRPPPKPKFTKKQSAKTSRQSKQCNQPRPPPKPIIPTDSKPQQSNVTTNSQSKPKIDYSTIAKDAKPYLGELKTLLEETEAEVFCMGERDRGKTDIMYHEAKITPGPPIAVPAYRTTPPLQKEMDKQVYEMLADNLVSHSTSPWSAPVLMVKKKNGEYRLVTDFRKLNARCERIVYPLPRIEDSLQKLKNPKFFSTMDLQKGFWQVPIAEADRKFFAFSTGTLHVEYNVMPMGALNSSATMQALMSLILRGLPAEHIICFLDDILVASSTMEDHLKHLGLVLGAIRRAGLKLNPKKCLFAQEEVTCLGHRLSREGIGPDPANLDKIRKWKPPRNRTEVRGFLGLTGYYRQMVQDYSRIAAPLTNLTKTDVDWYWTKTEQEAFETLRDYLTSNSIMAYPDFDRPFWVKPDASGTSVGYVLSQFDDNQKERVIAYGGKKLTDTQRRYSTYDREFFGVLTAVRAYSHYLRHKKFFVITDHRPLLNVRKIDPKTDATGRRVRWSIELNLYDFDIIYKKGRKHSDADAMSRLEHEGDYAEDEDFAGFMSDKEKEVFCLLGMDDNDAVTAVELISDDERRKELAEAQDEDEAIRRIKEFVRKRKSPPESFTEVYFRKHFKRFVIQDNILFRKDVYGTSSTPILQAVIPPKLVPDVLKHAHGSVISGHPGVQRLASILQRHATWPGIYRDIKKHVEKCPQCDQVSQPNPPPRTELQSINPEFVFEHVCCDLIQLPTVPAGWKYICVFMDVFSRHVTLYKLKDKSATSFTRILEDYVTHVGCPQKITCDNGSEFCNELVDAVSKVLGIKRKNSVVYRPQSQGMVERMNRQLIDQLTKRLSQFGKTWPEHMNYVALAHNAAPAARTGETPNMVFFGRELPIPTFTDLSVNTLRSKSVQEYVEEVQRRVKTVHEAVRKEAKLRSEKTAEAYNKKAKHTPLKEGELVYYKETPKLRTKLDPKYNGPVRVVARHSSARGTPGTTYTLQYKDGSTMTRNYEQLKRVKADQAEPINKEDVRLAPAPHIPRIPFPFCVDSSDEEPAKIVSDSPIATRTRNRVNRALPEPTVLPVPIEAVSSSQLNLPVRPPSLHDQLPVTTMSLPPATSAQVVHPTSPTSPLPTASLPVPRVPTPQMLSTPQQSVTPLPSSPSLPPPETPVNASQETPSEADPSEESSSELDSSEDHNYANSHDGTPSGNQSSFEDADDHLQPDPLMIPKPTVASHEHQNLQAAEPQKSPSSTETSPDTSNQTVIQASPEASNNHNSIEVKYVLPPPPELDTSSPPASNADSNSQCNIRATAHPEMELRKGVGTRKIDILVFRGHELRLDQARDSQSLTQTWRCRYYHRHKCNARLKLLRNNLHDIEGATVLSLVGHNQACQSDPFTINDSAIKNPQLNDTLSNSESASKEDVHAISMISDGDISRDFGPEELDARVRSSPVPLEQSRQSEGSLKPPLVDATTLALDTSSVDIRGYPVTKFVKAHPPADLAPSQRSIFPGPSNQPT